MPYVATRYSVSAPETGVAAVEVVVESGVESPVGSVGVGTVDVAAGLSDVFVGLAGVAGLSAAPAHAPPISSRAIKRVVYLELDMSDLRVVPGAMNPSAVHVLAIGSRRPEWEYATLAHRQTPSLGPMSIPCPQTRGELCGCPTLW
jgi:hypothetical protein